MGKEHAIRRLPYCIIGPALPPGVLQFCCVAPLNNFEVTSASIAQRVPGRPSRSDSDARFFSVNSGAHKSAVAQLVLAPPACHNRGPPAELHSAQTFEAGDTKSLITDGFETHQSSAHAQPTTIHAERDQGIKLHKSASVTILLQWPLLVVMAKLVASCISATRQHQNTHDISVISSVNQGTVNGRID